MELNLRVCAGLLVVTGCVIGETAPPAPGTPTPLAIDGIVTSPRHGNGRSDTISVEGLYGQPSAAISIERWDATAKLWQSAGTAVTSVIGSPDAGDTLYPFQIVIPVDDTSWPAGGLMSLRARIGNTALPSLDDEPATQHCLDDHTSWHDRIASCISGFPTLTLIDSDAAPPAALHRFIDTKGVSTPDDVAAYYQTINAPATVTDFLSTYGLDDPSVPTLTYYNLGDLATGREIRCKPHDTAAGTGVACTTFNYGVFGSAESDALDLAVAGRASHTGMGSFANVSMIYDPPITAPNAVKFMVYSSQGTLQLQAQLDTRGDNTSIPNNCLNCHATDSSYDLATHTATGARFLPFDPSAFIFSDQSSMTRTAQEAAMRALNQTFLQAAPSAALAETVRGWYGGSTTLAGTADTSVVPVAWQGADSAPTYRNVVAVACRGCHESRSDDLAFATPAQFRARAGQIIDAVCGTSQDASHMMPSAEASLTRFWSSSSRAYLAGFFGPEMVGACPPPVAPPAAQ